MRIEHETDTKNYNVQNYCNKADEWTERVSRIDRVIKVGKGGKKLRFRAVVIVGNKMGDVGVGVGKAVDVTDAISKSVANAKKHAISIKLTKKKTIPTLIIGKFNSAKVLLKPASEGTGVIAGSSIRTVLEMVGIENIFSKQLGSKNILNNARATICALKNVQTFSEIFQNRNLTLEKNKIN